MSVTSDMSVTALPAPRRGITVGAALSSAFLLALLVLAVFGAAFAPHDPLAQDPLRGVAGPRDGHLLGTDQLGRDVFSLLIVGTRSALMGPLAVALGCLLIGCPLGIWAAYARGAVDAVINRFADLIFAFPAFLILIVVVGVLGGGYWEGVIVLLLLSMPFQIRLVRSVATVQVRLPYVDAARTIGLGSGRIMVRHVLPNVRSTVLATVLLDFVGALIGFASLSYLGLGVPPGSPDWGSMLASGQRLVALNPWVAIAPGALLICTAASATVLGDWVYHRMSKQEGRP